MELPSHVKGKGRVVTLGMFIIDTFEYRDANGNQIRKEHDEQIGGGGVYAMLAARAFLPASQVGLIIDKGVDFPPRMLEKLLTYGEDMFYFRKRTDGARLTTKALNKYTGEERGFEYLTPRMRISISDLPTTPFWNPTPPSYIHFVCSPERVGDFLKEIKNIGSDWTPGLVWEPMPPNCVPEEFPAFQEVAKYMTVISPNHLEALSLLGVTPASTNSELKDQITTATKQLSEHLSVGSTVIIRSGGMGACICTKTSKFDSSKCVWIPAFFGPSDQKRVVDVTGGGNGFLGGLVAGLLLTSGDPFEASLYGSVAASYAIEQEGLPSISTSNSGDELWNGDSPATRLDNFRSNVEVAAAATELRKATQ